MGPADLPARLHEEPPGLPPWPPRTSVALLQLHVHARRVRTPPHCALLLGTSRGGKETLTLSLLLRSVQFGAAGLQRFTAAHDRRSLGDGSWHLTDQSAVHGGSARW